MFEIVFHAESVALSIFVVFDNMRLIRVMYTCNFPINTGSLKFIIEQFANDLYQYAFLLFHIHV